ncbi:MAG: peptidoglycan DD-metalloendopeptidase family protein [Peptococcaceae bacterium]|nr:peptidoglycan DD-metalloendopeptidase family protein [Peptococcaceae bacterium]
MKKSEPMARVIPVVNARMTPVPVHAVPPKSVSEESFFKRVRWTTFPWLSKKVVVTFFATFLALAGGIIYLNMTVPVVNIIVSDKQFGYTASLNEAREIFYDALHTLGEEKIDNDSIMTDEKVFFLPQRVDKKTYEENQASVDDIAQYINAYFPGFGIQVDGIDSGIVVATKEEAEEILTELRKYYETLSDDKIELVENNVYSVDYEEDVVVVDTQAQPLYIKSKKDALKDLIEGKLVSKTYEVVDEGVTVEDIAQTYKITAESILDANKDLGSAEDELALGSSVKVFVVEPYLTVIVSGLRVAKEEIEFEIETRKDPKLLVNATKVSQEGIPGSKDITFTFVSRNGIIDMDDENGYSVLSEAVTLEPVSRIILEGTGSTQLASAGSAVKISQGTGELPTLKWPTSGTITSRYRTPSRPNHNGIDIANPVGTPIYAASSGVVIFRGWATGYGNCVVIDHGNGVGTRYGHLSTFNVSAGDEVAWGQIIAGMGNTGNSTGPHLHFEVFLNTTGTQYYINPESAPYADH